MLTDTGKVVMEDDTLVGDPCIGVVVPQETAVDVDTEIDLELIGFWLKKNRKLDYNDLYVGSFFLSRFPAQLFNQKRRAIVCEHQRLMSTLICTNILYVVG